MTFAKRSAVFTEDLIEWGFWYILSRAHVLPESHSPVPTPADDPMAEILTGVLAAQGVPSDRWDSILRDVRVARSWVDEGCANIRMSAAAYDHLRAGLIHDWGLAATKGALVWPPTARTVAVRLGSGAWNDALKRLGVATSQRGRLRGGLRFVSEDYSEALLAYVEDARAQGRSISFEGYREWANRVRQAGLKVPSAATVRQHFGTWNKAIATVVPAIEG